MMDWQKPIAFFLCGPSGSSKTGLRKSLLGQLPNAVVASSDDFLESTARATGGTYADTYHRLRDEAQSIFLDRLAFAAERARPAIIDRTNLSPQVRGPLIEMLSETHRLIALTPNFDPLTPAAEEMIVARGLARSDRPGPPIPQSNLIEQCRSWVEPTEAEGFDRIERAVGNSDWAFTDLIEKPEPLEP